MFANRIVAALLLAFLTGIACRKKAPAPPPVPARPAPAAETHSAPAKSVPKSRSRPVAAPGVPAAPTQSAPPAVEPASPPPQLGQIVSQQERQAQTGALDAALQRTKRNLSMLSRRTLTPQERATVRQAQGLVIQAEEMRKSDLEAARSLAERAELLSRDVLGTR